MEGFHVCDPPMEPRLASAPTEWRCPECGTWWDAVTVTPQEVVPTYDFTTHQEIVPARWVRRN